MVWATSDRDLRGPECLGTGQREEEGGGRPASDRELSCSPAGPELPACLGLGLGLTCGGARRPPRVSRVQGSGLERAECTCGRLSLPLWSRRC